MGSGFKTRNTSLPYGILSDDETAVGLKPSTHLDGPFNHIPHPSRGGKGPFKHGDLSECACLGI